ncbi:MAG TPA: response regulator [Gaiellaceae bacterium]|nr:response regulator [Gaiellaceae bacterium]
MTIGDEEYARLAHDVMSPLAVIVGYAELLRTRDDEKIRRDAPEVIFEAAEQLRTAVRALVYGTDRADTAAAAHPNGSSPHLFRGVRRRIVVVDDDPIVRRLLRTTLPSESFDVLEASNGDAALRLVDGADASLVVLDWHLPGRTGDDVLAESKRRAPALPVLVLTAEQDPGERDRAVQLGADVFLTKPFSPSELLEAIERLLGESALDQGA